MKSYYVFRKKFNWMADVNSIKTIETWRDGLCFVFKEPDEDGDEDYQIFKMDCDISNRMIDMMPELIRQCEKETEKNNSAFLFIDLDKLYEWATKGKMKDSLVTHGKKNWEEFRETGLLTFINQFLHIFGWAIVLSYDDKTNELKEVYPARVSSRGFAYESQIRAYKKLTNYMSENAAQLKKEIDTQISN